MEFKAVRAYALSLPETTEEPHFDKTSFRVRGKIFATAPPGGVHLHIFVGEHTARAVAASEPAFEELWWGKQLSGVRIELADADSEMVCELLEDAWARKAPKRLVAQYDQPK